MHQPPEEPQTEAYALLHGADDKLKMVTVTAVRTYRNFFHGIAVAV